MSVVLGSLFITAIYAMVRRTAGVWWAWASGFTLVFLLFVIMITPVFINPAFNDYRPLPQGPAREAILSLARARQVPAHLLDKTSLPEIRAVLAHEMGHYVLNHGLRHALYFTLVFALGFLILERLQLRVLARWGENLGIRKRGDPATLPIVFAIFLTCSSPARC